MKGEKDMTLRDELPRSIAAQCATREKWRNNCRKNKEMEPKQNNASYGDLNTTVGNNSANFLLLEHLQLKYNLTVAAAAAAAKSLQSCPTLCDPIDSSPPGSLSLGFSRQECWSGFPFPSPMHESEK